MKKIFLNLSFIMLSIAALTLNGCKKESSTDDSVSAADAVAVSNGLDATSNDADNAAGQVSSISGKMEGLGLHLGSLCNSATITDTSSPLKQITVNYGGGFSCGGVTETGTVTIQLTSGTYWSDQGAVLTVTVTNLQFVDLLTGGTYTLNGAYTITNETGGLVYNLFNRSSTATMSRRHQTVGSGLSITFPNGSQRTWTFDRTRTFSSISGGYINVALSTQASTGVAMQGTTRYGEAFTNTIPVAIQATNNPGCLWKPWTGTWNHLIGNRSATVQFGTNISGTQVGVEGSCVSGEGYFITYTNNSRTRTRFIEYWQ